MEFYLFYFVDFYHYRKHAYYLYQQAIKYIPKIYYGKFPLKFDLNPTEENTWIVKIQIISPECNYLQKFLLGM